MHTYVRMYLHTYSGRLRPTKNWKKWPLQIVVFIQRCLIVVELAYVRSG